MKMTAKEAYLAGEALDILIHTRAHQLFDIGEEVRPMSKFEKGVEYATGKIGIVAGFDLWNRELKKLAALSSIAHMMDSMKVVMLGGKQRETAEALEYLSSLGLEHDAIERIWKQVGQYGKAEEVNGLWWPNTEAWTDEEAKRVFRQALNGEITSTIVTPGVERPLWMDKNIGLRMLGQFKSFAFSSLTKQLGAGLQQQDMALMSSTMISLALGALSYYFSALAAGGAALEEAMKLDPEKWADEAIARSGRLSLGQDAWEAMQHLPFIQEYTTLSGQRTTRKAGQDIVEFLGGPSFDALQKGANVLTGLDSPTQSTIHSLRLLLPFQNVLLLRRGFTAVEEAFNEEFDIPKRRQ